jgi:hypothetical protein
MDLCLPPLQDGRKTIEKYPGQLTDFALETLKETPKFTQHRQTSCQDDPHGYVLS